jgi:transposase
MQGMTLGGISRLLKRVSIRYKRARLYIHSPDPDYEKKRTQIERKRLWVRHQQGRYVLLYLDELTYYMQPTIARDYEARGAVSPLARLGYRSKKYHRIIAALNAQTGQVTFWHGAKVGVAQVAAFMEQLVQTYPGAETLYVVLDNNPMHYHPTVLSRLKPQHISLEHVLPPSWPTQVTPGSLPIEFLPLPTYASWLNPIEKLWRFLKQRVLHLHRYADRPLALQARVNAFLEQFAHGSDELLHYVGLLPY